MKKATYYKVEIKKAVRRQDNKYDPNRNIIPATIMERDGSTTPPFRQNQVFIDEWGVGSITAIAWNPLGILEAGTPVLVSKSPKPPYERTVLGVNMARLNQDQGNTNIPLLTLPLHARTHQWPEGNPGRDVVKVYQPALMPLRTYPATGLFVAVYRLIYRSGVTTSSFPGQLVDLTSAVPGVGLVRRVLLYLDRGTGVIATSLGTPVINNGIIPVPSPDIPDDAIPSADVQLVGGQTAITEASIIDRREFLERGESDLPPATEVGQVLYSVDGVTFTAELPVTTSGGWVVNNSGRLVVV